MLSLGEYLGFGNPVLQSLARTGSRAAREAGHGVMWGLCYVDVSACLAFLVQHKDHALCCGASLLFSLYLQLFGGK